MAAWTLLAWLLMGLVLIPLLSGALLRTVLRGERILIGNEELLAWLLRPEGLGYITLAGALLVMGAVVRYAGLFRIITDDLLGEAATVRQTLFALIPDTAALFRLCLAAVLVGLVLLTPLLLTTGAVYLTWLSEHDINFYLAETPPEWHRALLTLALVGVPWAAVTGYLILRSLPTLPAFLDGHRPARLALSRSWKRTRGQTLRLLRLLLLCIVTWWLVRVLAQTALFVPATAGLEALAGWTSSIVPIVFATAAYTLAAFAVDAFLSFFGFSFAAVLLTKFYYEDTDLHQIAPPSGFGLTSLRRDTIGLLRFWLHPWRSLPVAAVLILLSGSISGTLLWKVSFEPDFTVTAHRAGAFMGPENTLAALEDTIEAGADVAEIDVQRTADGVIVVVHDADLMRVAGDPRRVANTPFSEMQHLLQGNVDDGPPELRRVATLDDFLESARGRIGLNIEFKYYGWDPDLVPEVIARIRAHEMEDEVVLMSLDLRSVSQARELAPGIPVGYVATVSLGDLRRIPADFSAVPRPVATSRFVRAAARAEMDVHVWTLNRPDTMLAAIQAGAQGIITDDPVMAIRIREELADLTPVEQLLLSFRGLLISPNQTAGTLTSDESLD